MKPEYQTIVCKDSSLWRRWLADHHADTDGIWLRIYKKASGIPTVTYAEALDDALCYGWIDGLRRSYDEQSFVQKFTPRRAKSLWSKRNREYIERLTTAGLMQPAGIAEVERAKQDGRWDAAYDKPSEMTVPEYLLAALRTRPKAQQAFDALNKTNTYAILWRLQTAKTDATRQKRLDAFLDMLEAGEKLH